MKYRRSWLFAVFLCFGCTEDERGQAETWAEVPTFGSSASCRTIQAAPSLCEGVWSSELSLLAKIESAHAVWDPLLATDGLGTNEVGSAAECNSVAPVLELSVEALDKLGGPEPMPEHLAVRISLANLESEDGLVTPYQDTEVQWAGETSYYSPGGLVFLDLFKSALADHWIVIRPMVRVDPAAETVRLPFNECVDGPGEADGMSADAFRAAAAACSDSTEAATERQVGAEVARALPPSRYEGAVCFR